MTKSTIAAYLKHDSKSLGNLLIKFTRLKTWNSWLQEYLEEPNLLKHCQIVGVDKGSLIVIADNPHWVTRFRFYIPGLLVKLRTYPDLKDIRSICCKVRPLHYSAGKKVTRQPLVISSQTAEIMQDAADKIKNAKLKEVLMRMAERK